jgi:hypothetical protein
METKLDYLTKCYGGGGGGENVVTITLVCDSYNMLNELKENFPQNREAKCPPALQYSPFHSSSKEPCL